MKKILASVILVVIGMVTLTKMEGLNEMWQLPAFFIGFCLLGFGVILLLSPFDRNILADKPRTRRHYH